MDAQIPKGSVPLRVSLAVRFNAAEAEKVFDFTFKDYSKDPASPTAPTGPTSPSAPPTTPQISSVKAPEE